MRIKENEQVNLIYEKLKIRKLIAYFVSTER